MRGQTRPTEGAQSTWVEWCCPYCAASLVARGQALFCPVEERWFASHHGVNRLLSEERRQELQPCLEARRRLKRPEPDRAAEEDRAACLELGLRAAAAALGPGPWKAVEVGASSCRASLRLLRDGHRVAAAGLDLDEETGLPSAGASLPLDSILPRAEADLEALPFEPAFFDLVVAAGSFHQGPHVARTLVELRRVTRRDGVLLVLDSPVYRRRPDGEAMVAARMQASAGRGWAASREVQPGYLVKGELDGLFEGAGWRVEVTRWPDRLHESLQDAAQRLLHARPRSRYPILLARRQ